MDQKILDLYVQSLGIKLNGAKGPLKIQELLKPTFSTDRLNGFRPFE